MKKFIIFVFMFTLMQSFAKGENSKKVCLYFPYNLVSKPVIPILFPTLEPINCLC